MDSETQITDLMLDSQGKCYKERINSLKKTWRLKAMP